MTYKIGMVVEGVVTGIQPYGAFVSLDTQTQGLIHISEVKSGYIKNIRETLTIGEKIKIKIIDIDEYSKKISLSLRAMQYQPNELSYRRKVFYTNPKHKIGFSDLDESMPKWVEEALKELQ